MRRSRGKLQVKTPAEIERMRAAGLVVADALQRTADAVAPGVTTKYLDAVAAAVIRGHRALPSFLGYHRYPATICVSVNDEVVHGIPGDYALAEGDVVSIDCGAIVDGWHGDAAVTVGVGAISNADQGLIDVTEDALWRGIGAMRVGNHLSDIGHAIESYVRGRGTYGIVEDYTGHGIGTEMHQEPNVPNVGRPGRGPALAVGVVLAIEPMLTRGGIATYELADGWTVKTTDGSRAAHFEHTVAITEDGPVVLTATDAGAGRLGRA
jgi:methionyl aminopeptidase